MEQERIKGKLRITPKLVTLALAASLALTPIAGNAITDNSYNPGTFVKWADEELPYGLYIVKEGDNASRISEKVCSHLRIEITAKYWIVIALENNYPRTIKPGDVIKFPKTEEELLNEYAEIRASGKLARYVQKNNIYKETPKKRISMNAVAKILADFYGPEVCIDPDLIYLYLETTGLDKKYILTTDEIVDSDIYYDFGNWIPTIDELKEYREEKTQKTNKK